MNAVPETTGQDGSGAETLAVQAPRSRLDRNVGWMILGLLVLGCLVVIRPFLSALLWAVVLCYSSWPVYSWILKRFGGRRTLAALAMTGMIMSMFLLPFLIVGSTLVGNVESLADTAQGWVAQGPPPPPPWLSKVPVVGAKATERWRVLQADTAQLWKAAERLIQPLSAWAVRAALGLGGGLLNLGFSMLIALFLFRDGTAAARRLEGMLSRVAGERGRHLLRVAGSTVRGVVYGILGTSLFQAVLAGIGFMVAGVPGVGLLALLTFFASFIPVFGTALIWLPAALWLFSHSTTSWGVFMIIWGLVIGNVDNFIRPLLISQGSDMPFILILFGVIGGALTFGFIGIFIGPTLLAVGFRLLNEWSSMVQVGATATQNTDLASQ